MINMHFIPKPVAYPYMCGRCRSSDMQLNARGSWVMDTGMDADYEGYGTGRVYLCEECCLELVEVFPFAVTKDFFDVNVSQKLALNREVQEKLERYELVKKHWLDLGLDLEAVIYERSTDDEQRDSSEIESGTLAELCDGEVPIESDGTVSESYHGDESAIESSESDVDNASKSVDTANFRLNPLLKLDS